MSDSEKFDTDSPELARLRAIMRLTSFVLPSLVTVIALPLCLRHLTARSVIWAGLEISTAVLLAVFLNRRSRGLPARFFYASTAPDRDSQDQTDIGALWAAAIYLGGTIFILLKGW
jgi:hypothetical protein